MRLGSVRTVCAILAALLLVPSTAVAELGASAWSENDHASLRLVSSVAGIAEPGAASVAAAPAGPDLVLGLHFRMLPGWKIYWRSPGDVGTPPIVNWSRSENLAGAEILWPIPHRFEAFGLQTMGYEDEVVLPVEAAIQDRSRPLKLRASVDHLLCKEICIPYNHALTLELPPGEPTPTPFVHLIQRFRSQVPGGHVNLDMRLEEVRVARASSSAVLQVAARSALPMQAPDLFVEGVDGYQFPAPEVKLSERGRRALLTVPVKGSKAYSDLAGSSLVLTLVDGERAIEHRVDALPTGSMTVALEKGLVAVLGLALLGGLILNLMPCVLPVLSIKLLGVIKLGGRQQGEVRGSFLSVAAGIVASFLALAASLVALKAAGAPVGWGIQFQQPLFLVAMVLVLGVFACNLAGWFEFRLPRLVTNLAVAGPNVRHEAAGQEGLVGNFLTGMLATLLATPCSAPFLGTVVGFALARDAAEIFAVFAALGVGLALPYFAVAARPGLVAVLPRPGSWMISLRRVLALALAGTAVWLATILGVQAGPAVALALAALMVVLALLFRFRRLARESRQAAYTGALALVVVVALMLPFAGEAVDRQGSETEGGAIRWREFNHSAIGRLVEADQVVLVNVTADWCISCKVNKSLVLDRGEVARRLSSGEVVPMVADWTNPNQTISTYLASFGRYGIPFNAVYGPAAPSGLALAEILTPNEILGAFERAGGSERRSADSLP